MAEGPIEDAIDIAEAVRWEILQHAEDLFAHYGFTKTGMADIARRSGMSPANLYRYYRNKQAIGLAVAEAFLRRSEAEMATAFIREKTPEARIRALIVEGVRNLMAEMEKSPRIMELVDFLMSEDEGWQTVQRHVLWKREHVMAELERGMAAGLFAEAPLKETAINLMHATKAFQTPAGIAAWRDLDTVRPELEGVLDLIFKGVRA